MRLSDPKALNFIPHKTFAPKHMMKIAQPWLLVDVFFDAREGQCGGKKERFERIFLEDLKSSMI
jgi:hypothetical protein